MQDVVSTAGGVLKIEHRTEGKFRVLRASGQLTEKECKDFMDILNRERASGSPRLILDVEGLVFLSSAGLGALVAAHQSFADSSARMILSGTNAKVRKLLALTNLDRLIEVADSVEEALKLP